VSSVQAGGFMLYEQSVAGTGRAYAGAGVHRDDDLSAAWYNPAGMTLLDGTQIQFGGTIVFTTMDLHASPMMGGRDNGRKKFVPVPNMYLTHKVNDSWWLGLSLNVPYGMAQEYARGRMMNNWGVNSEMKVFDLSPSIAYKVNDKLSVGGGFSIQYAKSWVESAEYQAKGPYQGKLAYGRLVADSWSAGVNLGVMWTPVETLRLGIGWRSEVRHDADGTYRFGIGNLGDSSPTAYSIHAKGSATVRAPQNITLSAVWDVTPKWDLAATIRWYQWSSFDKLIIKNDSKQLAMMGASTKVMDNDWKNSWFFSIGTDYRINDEWTVRAGFAYEDSPVVNEKRTALIPDADRIWISLGATWKMNKQLRTDFGFTWIHGVGNMGLYKGEQKVAEYDNIDCILLGAQMVYKF
jgi:long-chain fatty acid transport protein